MKRFDFIAERVLKIWSIPNIIIEEQTENSLINIFEAGDPTHKKLEYAVFFDQKIEINQVSKLYMEVLKQLFDLQPETFFTTDLANKIGLTRDPNVNKTRSPAKLNDTYFIEAGYSSKDKFDRMKQALTIFNFEDELMIKYSDEITADA